MANLFDKTYDKLLNLKESFDTKAEVEDFFDNFLIRLTDQLSKALPNTSWKITKVPYNSITINAPDEKTVSVQATIQGVTSDFDVQADFDFSNPIRHKGWEEYKFKGLGTTTCLALVSYLVEFEKHGIYLGKFDNRFPKVDIVVKHMNFLKEPYAFKYDTGNTKIRVSNFAKELIADFEIELSYSEASNNVKPIPRIERDITVQDFYAAATKSKLKQFLDNDYDYEEADKTDEFKAAIKTTLNWEEVIKKIGEEKALYEKASDNIAEVKIGTFAYDDPKVYPADPYCNEPHYVTWQAKDPEFPAYVVITLVRSAAVFQNIINRFNPLPKEVLADAVEYFKVYKRDNSKDFTDAINKYISKIYEEITQGIKVSNSKFTPTEVKLIEALDGLIWKAEFRENGPAKVFNGTGYTKELKETINEGRVATKFIILGGDF